MSNPPPTSAPSDRALLELLVNRLDGIEHRLAALDRSSS